MPVRKRPSATMTAKDYMRTQMSEAQLHSAIVDYIKRQKNWHCFYIPDWLYKLAMVAMKRSRRGDREWSEPGFPDLVIVQAHTDLRTPVRLIFAELKSTKGAVRDVQSAWLRSLMRVSGIEVYIWRPDDWLDDTVNKIIENGPMPYHEGTRREMFRMGISEGEDTIERQETGDGTE